MAFFSKIAVTNVILRAATNGGGRALTSKRTQILQRKSLSQAAGWERERPPIAWVRVFYKAGRKPS